ncbi:hypothetical protein [Chryseolinea lacunae]|uniref:Lipocalin-like domain-containing protein n=1 Tax=Chryseolinea lacunae TaxID=2801331 RepID=A0ABS1KQ45_9BACT|nr:hypothetical protein [Chryseolinea lacunae]MBL0741440.1 hypothetical protein [Chryseolinea lacunae]
MKRAASIVFLSLLSTLFFTCSSNNDDPTPIADATLGTFAGNIQVSDDPHTKVGYVYNAKVTVIRSGSTGTVKIVGDAGFSREYTGTLTTQVAGMYDIAISKQTKPQEKVAGEHVLIMNNKLTITLDVANDAVTVRENPTATQTIQITGKLQMIGTDMLLE